MDEQLLKHRSVQIVRASSHRPAPIRLPDEPNLATASVLALINGADRIERASALEALMERAASLSDADPTSALLSLATQLPVLNALFLLFSAEAVTTKTTEARAAFLRLALQAQSAYARSQAIIVQVQQAAPARMPKQNPKAGFRETS